MNFECSIGQATFKSSFLYSASGGWSSEPPKHIRCLVLASREARSVCVCLRWGSSWREYVHSRACSLRVVKTRWDTILLVLHFVMWKKRIASPPLLLK